MWHERYSHAAVHIPGYGILVIGGSLDNLWLCTVELLPFRDADEKDLAPWRNMSPMLQAFQNPTACYFEGSVYVCSEKNGEVDFESFNINAGDRGQWTSIRCHLFTSHCYNHLVDLSGKLYTIGNYAAQNPSRRCRHMELFPIISTALICRC